jgi:hypothetical protein
MEQLVIFLLFVVASIVSSIIQKKKKAEEEAAHRNAPVPAGTKPPVTRWPRSAQEWQEQLRKMVEENAPPVIKKPATAPAQRGTVPPLTRPIAVKVLPPEKSEGDIELKSPLRDSVSAYKRAANLHDKVGERLRAVDQQTTTHRAAVPRRAGASHAAVFARSLRRRPAALRDAFISSVIFSPPKSLEESGVGR